MIFLINGGLVNVRSNFLKGNFFGFFLRFSTLFICRPSDSTVLEEAGIEPSNVTKNYFQQSQMVLVHRFNNHNFAY
jgi:hypothetical protein